MKKIIVFLILPIIGFSQDCENSILDEIVTNSEVNQYFQIALALNATELDFLNDCDTDLSYTMFVPGNDVPTESVSVLLGLSGELMDYIPYYITTEMGSVGPAGTILIMMDGNPAELTVDFPAESVKGMWINDVNVSGSICACNGIIYIIDDLIWAPGVINLDENNHKVSFYPNPATDILNISGIQENGVLEIKNVLGEIVFLKEIGNDIQLNLSQYKTGMYVVSFKSQKTFKPQPIFIN